MLTFLNTIYFSNSIKNYLIFIGIIIVGFILMKIFKTIILKQLEMFFSKTKNKFDDLFVEIIEGISNFFYWFLPFYIALDFITLPNRFESFFEKLLIILIIYEVISAISKIIDKLIKIISERKDKSSKAAYLALGKGGKWIIWLIGILVILDNFNINITALATGLGIGGIAIAFALQGILKDLFSYFSILLDKPVRIGDYIHINDKKGKVQDIGVKTTRLKAVDGEEIVVANDLITSGSLRNFGKAKDRRVNIQYGVGYDTDVKTLKKLKKEIIKIISSFEEVDFSRCHLRNLSESSMDYDIVYHIKTRDYNIYMDINEEINFKILELFEKNKVEIPFPTKTIYNRKG